MIFLGCINSVCLLYIMLFLHHFHISFITSIYQKNCKCGRVINCYQWCISLNSTGSGGKFKSMNCLSNLIKVRDWWTHVNQEYYMGTSLGFCRWVANVLVPNRCHGTSNYHADSTVVMVSYDVYIGIRIMLKPLNKLWLREVGNLATYQFLCH